MAAPGAQPPFQFAPEKAWNKSVKEFIEEMAKDPRLAPSQRDVLGALAAKPAFAKTVATTHLDALDELNELKGRTTATQYALVLWTLGLRNRPPGAGNLGDLRIGKDGAIDGRPSFPKLTNEALPPQPGLARRHIIAWHTIRKVANRRIAKEGLKAVADECAALLGKAPLPPKLGDEVKTLFADGKDAWRFGAEPDRGRAVLKALFVANGNPNNLWRGSSSVNSALPKRFEAADNVLKGFTKADDILGAALGWASDGKSEKALVWAGLAIRDVAEDLLPEGADPDKLLELLRGVAYAALVRLESDEPVGKEAALTPAQQAMVKLGDKVYQALYVSSDPKQLQGVGREMMEALLKYP